MPNISNFSFWVSSKNLNSLVSYQNEYEQGQNSDYNKDYAIDETRLFRFLEETQKEKLEMLGIYKRI